jgi:hypothetical protein
VTFIQNGACVLVLFILKVLSIADMKPITYQQWKIVSANGIYPSLYAPIISLPLQFSVCALMLIIQIVTMLFALPRVAIASTVVFRNVGTVIVVNYVLQYVNIDQLFLTNRLLQAVIEYTFFGKSLTYGSIAGLAVSLLVLHSLCYLIYKHWNATAHSDRDGDLRNERHKL